MRAINDLNVLYGHGHKHGYFLSEFTLRLYPVPTVFAICQFGLSLQARSPASEEAPLSPNLDRVDPHPHGGVVLEGRRQDSSR